MTRRGIVLVVVLCAAAFGSACFKRWGRDLGGAAVTEVKQRSPELLVPLRDSVFVAAGRMYDDSLRPRLDATLAALFDSVHADLGTLEDSAARYIEHRLSQALGRLLTENLGLARDSLRAAIRSWLRELRDTGAASLAPLAATAADSAMTRAVATLDSGLGGPLRTTILGLVVEVADSVRAQARKAADEPFFKSILDRLGLVGGLVAGAILAAVIGAVVFVALSLRNSRRALDAVAAAVRDRGDADLRKAVQRRAMDRNVESWLHGYLARRNLLGGGQERD